MGVEESAPYSFTDLTYIYIYIYIFIYTHIKIYSMFCMISRSAEQLIALWELPLP